MKVRRATFRAAANTVASLPAATRPEVAVAGRSNVGKSSLLNAMTGQRGLARTSRTPGCTRGLLFYDVDDWMTLVDLPGYGYASRSHTEREGWKKLIEHYLSTRQELAGVLILVDVRRGPEEEESALAEYLESVGLPCAFVLTKADKLKRSQLARQSAAIAKVVAPAIVMPTSSQEGTGIDVVWRWIRAAVETEARGEDDDVPDDAAVEPAVAGDHGPGDAGPGATGPGK